MRKNTKNKDENNKDNIIYQENESNEIKRGFFKKVWYSINKIEKYSELSAEGFVRAIKYFIILTIILSTISSVITVYKTSLEIKKIAQYIDEKSPEFTYHDGTLQIDSQEVIIDDSSSFGKVIIDTKADSEEQINQYIDQVSDEENAIVILKNKLILKEIGIQGTSNYNYKELFEEMGIAEFNKQQLVDYLTNSNIMSLYLNLFLVLFIYAFIIYFINTLFYIITISVVGYIATIILKLKIRYVAIFNMAIYAITLPTILNMAYMIINALYRYTINYFDIMYILVASIYMIAAIFILKSEFNKKQGEVQKIVKVEKEVKQEMNEEQKEENEKENKNTEKKDKKKKEKTKDDKANGEEPEGSNA